MYKQTLGIQNMALCSSATINTPPTIEYSCEKIKLNPLLIFIELNVEAKTINNRAS